MIYKITKSDSQLHGETVIPASRRMNNRYLEIRAIRKRSITSEDETEWKKNELKTKLSLKSIKKLTGESASAVRYLETYFKKKQGEWVIYGAKSLKKGPVPIITKALEHMGGNIRFEEAEEFAPLKMTGSGLKGLTKQINAVISRDVITVTLFIDPDISLERATQLKDEIVNSSFIDIGLKLLKSLGIQTRWSESEVLVEHDFVDGQKLSLEADWGMAAYWYETMALANRGALTIHNLNRDSVQRERRVCKIYKAFGVDTTYISNGIIISKTKSRIKKFEHDFSEYPDLIPSLTVTCCFRQIPFKIKGLSLLEERSEGITQMLQTNLAKFGFKVKLEDDALTWEGKDKIIKDTEVYLDFQHKNRLAMAFYPLAITGKSIMIEGGKKIPQGYPNYWDAINKLGFETELI